MNHASCVLRLFPFPLFFFCFTQTTSTSRDRENERKIYSIDHWPLAPTRFGITRIVARLMELYRGKSGVDDGIYYLNGVFAREYSFINWMAGRAHKSAGIQRNVVVLYSDETTRHDGPAKINDNNCCEERSRRNGIRCGKRWHRATYRNL